MHINCHSLLSVCMHRLTLDYEGDEVHVVVELRAINPAKSNSHSSARHIANTRTLLQALRALPGVRVTAQDFAQLPFAQQVALSHSAGVFVSMHGAGTTHIMHMALGRDRCCALVELQPDHTQGFQDAQGYGNLARMFGLHYFRYEAADGATTKNGTSVDVMAVTDLVRKAAEAVRITPTCLHDVKDISLPVFPINYFEK